MVTLSPVAGRDFDDEHLRRLEQDYQSGRRARRGLPFFRGRRGATRKALAALGVFLVFGGFIPIARYVETATVPSGERAQQAEVLSVDPIPRARRESSSRNGRSATVRLPDGTTDSVYLTSRLSYPDAGDTLTVYREDGRLRTTAERSRLELVGGILAVVVIPALGLAYWRSQRRSS